MNRQQREEAKFSESLVKLLLENPTKLSAFRYSFSIRDLSDTFLTLLSIMLTHIRWLRNLVCLVHKTIQYCTCLVGHDIVHPVC